MIDIQMIANNGFSAPLKQHHGLMLSPCAPSSFQGPLLKQLPGANGKGDSVDLLLGRLREKFVLGNGDLTTTAPPPPPPTTEETEELDRIASLQAKILTLRSSFSKHASDVARTKEELKKVRGDAVVSKTRRERRVQQLTQQIDTSSNELKCGNMYHNIVRKNSMEVLRSARQALDDVPEDREELEMECEWELNMKMIMMDRMIRELVEKRRIVRVARNIVLVGKKETVDRCCDVVIESNATLIAASRKITSTIEATTSAICSLVEAKERKVKELGWKICDAKHSSNDLESDVMKLLPPGHKEAFVRRRAHERRALAVPMPHDISVACMA